MTRRTSDSALRDLERALLSAGRDVASPDPDALRRTLDRAESAIAVVPAGGVGAPGSLESAVLGTKHATLVVLSKWLAVGMVVGGVGFGIGGSLTRSKQTPGPTTASEPPPAVTPATPRKFRHDEPTSPSASAQSRPKAARPLHADRAAMAPSATAGPTRQSPPSRGLWAAAPGGLSPELAAELALLDNAQAALEGGDRAAAFAALDRYEQRFPDGQLRPEAALLRHKVRTAALTDPPQ